MKATIVSATDQEAFDQAIATAESVIKAHKPIVIPTDTVYGIAADAFSVEGVTALLAAKGRTRQMPPPVLIYDKAVLAGLADEVSADARALADAFWPGALTLIFYSQPSLNWDLGETQGTVALRVPNDPVAIELLKKLGPLAVSSANKTGRVAATTADEAMEQLGADVEVILDGGPRPAERADDFESVHAQPSTIVDCTSDRLIVVREGAISVERLREVVPSVVTRAEFDEQEKARREAETALAQTQQAMSTLENDSDEQETDVVGPKAAAPVAGSLAAHLVSHSGVNAVDQKRTATVHSAPVRTVEDNTKPFTVAEARALVFGARSSTTAGITLESTTALAELDELEDLPEN